MNKGWNPAFISKKTSILTGKLLQQTETDTEMLKNLISSIEKPRKPYWSALFSREVLYALESFKRNKEKLFLVAHFLKRNGKLNQVLESEKEYNVFNFPDINIDQDRPTDWSHEFKRNHYRNYILKTFQVREKEQPRKYKECKREIEKEITNMVKTRTAEDYILDARLEKRISLIIQDDKISYVKKPQKKSNNRSSTNGTRTQSKSNRQKNKS